MADLNPLEEKLGEVTGLAAAAIDATKKVEALLDDDHELAAALRKQREEAEETESRCTELAGEREGKKTAILDKAAETKSEAKQFMDIYLGGEDTDELDGFEFLTMTEAGEAGHWAVLGKLNEKAGEDAIGELVDWALPIQERHFQEARDGSLQLAAEEDPYEED
jgi:hypothetical protein